MIRHEMQSSSTAGEEEEEEGSMGVDEASEGAPVKVEGTKLERGAIG